MNKNRDLYYAVFYMVVCILSLGGILGLVSCNDCPECPPVEECPECPETLDCPVGFYLVQEELKWECIEDSEPPPGMQPSDYISLRRVPDIVNNLTNELQYLWFQAHVDPLHVVTHCSWIFTEEPDFFFMSRSQMENWALIYLGVKTEAEYMQANLPIVNTRCDTLGGEWCEKSKVRKSRYEPFNTTWSEYKRDAQALRLQAITDPILNTCEYDSIKGWCTCRNKER